MASALSVNARAEAAALVVITGGADVTGHHYTWTVRNAHTSPVMSVEFPHHAADVFTPPPGWTAKCNNLVGQPGKPGPSVCLATAPSVATAIGRGESAVFSMRIAPPPASAQKGLGKVKVQFADGTETSIDGVEVPTRVEAGSRFMPLIGLGLVFGLWVLVKALRGKRGASSTTVAGGSGVGDAEEDDIRPDRNI